MDNNEIDSLYEELLKIEEIFIKSDAATEHIEDEKAKSKEKHIEYEELQYYRKLFYTKHILNYNLE